MVNCDVDGINNYLLFNDKEVNFTKPTIPTFLIDGKIKIPKSFKSLDLLAQSFPALKTLRLPDSKLFNDGALPESLGRLTSLTSLYMFPDEDEECIDLPDSFSKLTGLKHFAIRSPLGSIGPIQHCTALNELVLGLENTRPSQIPDFVGNLTLLTNLCLSVKGYPCSLPNSIGNLKQLKHLYIVIDSSEELPESLGDLCSLTFLRLDNCEGLTHLPTSLSKLTALEELAIVRCPYLEILANSFLCNMKRLKALEFSKCCSLSEIPSSIGQLQLLESLKLDHCCSLTTLPSSIGNLKSLLVFRLFLCRNITTLPDSLTQLTSLQLFKMYPRLNVPNINALSQHFYDALTHCGCECMGEEEEDEGEYDSEPEYEIVIEIGIHDVPYSETSTAEEKEEDFSDEDKEREEGCL